MVQTSVVPRPTNLTATSVSTGIRLDWDNPALRVLEVVQVYESPDNAWANASKIAETRSNTWTSVLDPGIQRWYWVRSKRNNGKVSIRDPDSDTSTVTATAGPSTAQQVRLASQYFSFAVASDALATDGRASFRFKNDGRIVGFDIDDNEFEFSQPAFWWFRGQQAGVGDNFEVRLASNTSGSWDSGAAVGTWVALTSDQTWYREVSRNETDGLYIVESVFEIRSATTTGDTGEKRIEASADFKATVKVTA